MREILFKAKAINRDGGYHRTNYKNGDWVYGLVTRLYDGRFEFLPATMTNTDGVSGIEIDHNTICQYTGLTDKNGNKIWENDIVNCPLEECCGKVIWNENEALFAFAVLCEDGMFEEEYLYDFENYIEVIGNIFDNKELLGE